MEEKRVAAFVKGIVEHELDQIPGQAGTMFLYQPDEPQELMAFINDRKAR